MALNVTAPRENASTRKIECIAKNTSPAPVVTFSLIGPDGVTHTFESDRVTIDVEHHPEDRSYDVRATSTVDLQQLAPDGSSVIECRVSVSDVYNRTTRCQTGPDRAGNNSASC